MAFSNRLSRKFCNMCASGSTAEKKAVVVVEYGARSGDYDGGVEVMVELK